MSARAPGAPSNAGTNRMRLNAETGNVSTSKRYIWQIPRGDAAASNDFPIVATRKDPYDTTANIKAEFAREADVGGNWMVPFTEGDADYLKRKRDDQEKALFDSWVMTKYDITDPAQNLMLQTIAPELFQRREEVIDSQQALAGQYAKLRLRGAKSLDDLEMEWRIETGRLDLPRGPIWDPMAWRDAQSQHGLGAVPGNPNQHDADWNARRYRHGMFSPLKWLTANTSGWGAAANRADIRGDAANAVVRNIPVPGNTWANYWGGNPVMYPVTPANTTGDPVPNAIGNNAAARAGARDVAYGHFIA